jgi:hypothetical protein
LFARVFESRLAILSSAFTMLQFFKQLLIFFLIILVVLIMVLISSSILSLEVSRSFSFSSYFILFIRSFPFTFVIELASTFISSLQCILFFQLTLFLLFLVILVSLNVAIFDENFLGLLQVDLVSAALVDTLVLVHHEVLPELNSLLFVLDAEHNSMLVELLSNSVGLRSRLLGIVIHQTHHDVLFKS